MALLCLWIKALVGTKLPRPSSCCHHALEALETTGHLWAPTLDQITPGPSQARLQDEPDRCPSQTCLKQLLESDTTHAGRLGSLNPKTAVLSCHAVSQILQRVGANFPSPSPFRSCWKPQGTTQRPTGGRHARWHRGSTHGERHRNGSERNRNGLKHKPKPFSSAIVLNLSGAETFWDGAFRTSPH